MKWFNVIPNTVEIPASTKPKILIFSFFNCVPDYKRMILITGLGITSVKKQYMSKLFLLLMVYWNWKWFKLVEILLIIIVPLKTICR